MVDVGTPLRALRSLCCGHAAAAPPAGRSRRTRRYYRLAGLGAAVALVAVLAPAQSGLAISDGNGLNITLGFDICALPSTTDMLAWWDYSPYYWYNVYIGGVDYGCNLPSDSYMSSWLNTVNSYGWNFEYTWVGPQAPSACEVDNSGYFSYVPSTAYSQGEAQENDAADRLEADGVEDYGDFVPLLYDLEGYSQGTCDDGVYSIQSAVDAFIEGWDAEAGTGSYDQVPGVYGSVCASYLADLAGISPVPYFIWGADWDENYNTAVMDDGPGGCGVPNGDWVYNQRLKQYWNSVEQTWGGYTLTVDEDCANSLTTPSGTTSNTCADDQPPTG
jgi:hypothetical protein